MLTEIQRLSPSLNKRDRKGGREGARDGMGVVVILGRVGGEVSH